MRVARSANALGLAYAPLAHTLEDQSPDARRNSFSAFIYAAAILKEALDSAQALGKWYREYPQYKEGFGALFKDPEISQLRNHDLDVLRDKFVFHFDREAMAEALLTFPMYGDIRVISYPFTGPTVGETYFDAADDAALGRLFGTASSDEDYFSRLEAFMVKVNNLMLRFMSASHRIVAVGLLELGCKKKVMARPVASTDP